MGTLTIRMRNARFSSPLACQRFGSHCNMASSRIGSEGGNQSNPERTYAPTRPAPTAANGSSVLTSRRDEVRRWATPSAASQMQRGSWCHHKRGPTMASSGQVGGEDAPSKRCPPPPLRSRSETPMGVAFTRDGRQGRDRSGLRTVLFLPVRWGKGAAATTSRPLTPHRQKSE